MFGIFYLRKKNTDYVQCEGSSRTKLDYAEIASNKTNGSSSLYLNVLINHRPVRMKLTPFKGFFYVKCTNFVTVSLRKTKGFSLEKPSLQSRKGFCKSVFKKTVRERWKIKRAFVVKSTNPEVRFQKQTSIFAVIVFRSFLKKVK